MAQSAWASRYHGLCTLMGKETCRKVYGRLLSGQARNSVFGPREGTTDPGNWVFSPEWWGTQGRGWGRNSGITVFERSSQMGNGLVSVTAHPASSSGLEDWPELSTLLQGKQVTSDSEWRVLRFNNETRQSVAKVVIVEGQNSEESQLMQIPHCLAFEYLKSMISVGLSSIHCGGFDLDFVAKGERTMRCLCIGLGGGSLPIFLANKLQGCHVDVVEIDDTVISAAIDCMGFPKIEFKTFPSDVRSETLNAMCDESHMEVKLGVESLSHTQCYDIPRRIASSMLEFPLRISGFEADAVMYVGHLAGAKQSQQHYDLVFIDAFNGDDEVPVDFWTRGGSFLTGLRDLLDPHHGTVVVNLHTDLPPPSFLERITGNFGPGYDPLLPGGKRLQEISQAYRDKLLHCWSAGLSEDEICGAAFTVAVPRQQNICLVVCRGIRGTEGNIIDNLSSAALSLENILHVPFPMSKRATRGFQLVHG